MRRKGAAGAGCFVPYVPSIAVTHNAMKSSESIVRPALSSKAVKPEDAFIVSRPEYSIGDISSGHLKYLLMFLEFARLHKITKVGLNRST